jgi:hypothetical protein
MCCRRQGARRSKNAPTDARKLWNAFCGCGWYHVSDDELNENQSS